MPINAYFKGNGNQVMKSMKNTYSNPAKAKSVFYATANAKGMKPKGEPSPAGLAELGRPTIKRKLL